MKTTKYGGLSVQLTLCILCDFSFPPKIIGLCMRMICNYLITLLLLLGYSSFHCNGEKDVCSPALVQPSPVQHQWAEDGLEVSILQEIGDNRESFG